MTKIVRRIARRVGEYSSLATSLTTHIIYILFNNNEYRDGEDSENNSKTSTPRLLLLLLSKNKDEYRDDEDSDNNSKTSTSILRLLLPLLLLNKNKDEYRDKDEYSSIVTPLTATLIKQKQVMIQRRGR